MATLLLANGAEVNGLDERGWTPLDSVERGSGIALSPPLDPHARLWSLLRDHGGHSGQDESVRELLRAVRLGSLDDVKRAIEEGSDVNASSLRGETLMHLAAGGGHLKTVSYLLEHGADANASDQTGRTPLHRAAGRPYVDVIECLLGHGADMNVASHEGYTPLMDAVAAVIRPGSVAW